MGDAKLSGMLDRNGNILEMMDIRGKMLPYLGFGNHWWLKWETVELGEINNFLEFKCWGNMEQEEI